MTPTRDIAAWVARTEFADLPPRVVEEAKTLMREAATGIGERRAGEVLELAA